jgi:hypothetical protein
MKAVTIRIAIENGELFDCAELNLLIDNIFVDWRVTGE